MQYELTEEQLLLQTTVRRLAKDKVSPGATARDESEEFDWNMVELLRENGLYGTDFPEIHGGSDAGMLALCLAIEELSKADASTGLLIADQELGALPILLAGNESQKQKLLP
jgi:alkylation response protein AidB-like acyl-CoA dehydrogenase